MLKKERVETCHCQRNLRSAGNLGMSEPVDQLVKGILAGQQRAAARAIRLIDDRVEGYRQLCVQLFPHTGRAYVLGITGSPGSGKSSVVDAMVGHFRQRDLRVGVVAVDPSSPYSGGAILGDRIRMQRHFLDDGVFIRSVATRGALGGLSSSASDVIRVLDAFGSDVVLVETVGVGQDELDIAGLAHTTVVVTAPGFGDGIQAVKAGILEIADVFVVNKADKPGAEATVADLEQMIAMGKETAHTFGHGHATMPLPTQASSSDADWTPPVIRTSATQGNGISELLEACERHRRYVQDTDQGRAQQALRLEKECLAIFRETVLVQAERKLGPVLGRELERVRTLQQDPYTTAERLAQMASGDKI